MTEIIRSINYTCQLRISSVYPNIYCLYTLVACCPPLFQCKAAYSKKIVPGHILRSAELVPTDFILRLMKYTLIGENI